MVNILIRNIVEMTVDSVVINNWPQSGWVERHIFQLLAVIISGLIGFLSALFILKKQRQHSLSANQLTAYHLLVALCNEMKRNLERTWYFIELREEGKFGQSVLVDDAKISCLQEFVKLTKDQSILNFILPFYGNVRLINIHQVTAIEARPADPKPNEFIMAANFAMNKYSDMCDQYAKTWERLRVLAEEVKQKISNNLNPIEEEELEERKKRIIALKK